MVIVIKFHITFHRKRKKVLIIYSSVEMVGFDFVNAGLGSRHSCFARVFWHPFYHNSIPTNDDLLYCPPAIGRCRHTGVDRQCTSKDDMPCHGGEAGANAGHQSFQPLMSDIPRTDELKLLPTMRTLGCLLTCGIPRTDELKLLPTKTLHQCSKVPYARPLPFANL